MYVNIPYMDPMGLGGEALEVLLSQKKTGHWIFLSSLTRQKAEEPRPGDFR